MARAITLAGFEATFRGNADPWRTLTARDERRKRQAILRAMGPGPHGRVLELASGNGSNSVALARRARRLDATDGAPTAVALTLRALAGQRGAVAQQLVLPARFPAMRYDAIVAAEILYYLTPAQLAATVREIARSLRPGGRLILAHHHLRFSDVAQAPSQVHARVVDLLAGRAHRRWHLRTARWRVEGFVVR
jgi:SAM-dependent methyltransferase